MDLPELEVSYAPHTMQIKSQMLKLVILAKKLPGEQQVLDHKHDVYHVTWVSS